MNGFITLSDGLQCLFLVPLYVLMIIETCLFLLHFTRVRSLRRFPVIIFPLVLTSVLSAVLLDMHITFSEGAAFGPLLAFLAALPWILWAALILPLSAWAVLSELDFIKKYRYTVSSVSIKEGTDNLPVGLCFYSPDGKALLTNRRMETLCQVMTGDGLLNASAFWNTLLEMRGSADPDSPIWIELDDGSTWIFSRDTVSIHGKDLYQITASDATRLHEIGNRLRSGNDELRRFNERLRQHSINIDDLTREEEILAAKINIHDELGQALLASKFYLTQSGSDIINDLSPDNLIKMWQQDIALLRKEAHPPAAFDPMRELTDAAASVGVNVMIFGETPSDDQSAMNLLFSAARVCLTNAVRHANASAMNITIDEKNGEYFITITNNGMPPAGTIQEGGGLSSLRRRVEDAGGTMSIFSQPEFKLTLFIPAR